MADLWQSRFQIAERNFKHRAFGKNDRALDHIL
jgi:hypothetical protein